MATRACTVFIVGSSLFERDRNSFDPPSRQRPTRRNSQATNARIACNGSQLGLYFQIPSNRLASVLARVARRHP